MKKSKALSALLALVMTLSSIAVLVLPASAGFYKPMTLSVETTNTLFTGNVDYERAAKATGTYYGKTATQLVPYIQPYFVTKGSGTIDASTSQLAVEGYGRIPANTSMTADGVGMSNNTDHTKCLDPEDYRYVYVEYYYEKPEGDVPQRFMYFNTCASIIKDIAYDTTKNYSVPGGVKSEEPLVAGQWAEAKFDLKKLSSYTGTDKRYFYQYHLYPFGQIVNNTLTEGEVIYLASIRYEPAEQAGDGETATVSFDMGTNTYYPAPEPFSVNIGETNDLPEPVVGNAEKFTFLGWSLNGTDVLDETSYVFDGTEDTLTALWSIDPTVWYISDFTGTASGGYAPNAPYGTNKGFITGTVAADIISYVPFTGSGSVSTLSALTAAGKTYETLEANTTVYGFNVGANYLAIPKIYSAKSLGTSNVHLIVADAAILSYPSTSYTGKLTLTGLGADTSNLYILKKIEANAPAGGVEIDNVGLWSVTNTEAPINHFGYNFTVGSGVVAGIGTIPLNGKQYFHKARLNYGDVDIVPADKSGNILGSNYLMEAKDAYNVRATQGLRFFSSDYTKEAAGKNGTVTINAGNYSQVGMGANYNSGTGNYSPEPQYSIVGNRSVVLNGGTVGTLSISHNARFDGTARFIVNGGTASTLILGSNSSAAQSGRGGTYGYVYAQINGGTVGTVRLQNQSSNACQLTPDANGNYAVKMGTGLNMGEKAQMGVVVLEVNGGSVGSIASISGFDADAEQVVIFNNDLSCSVPSSNSHADVIIYSTSLGKVSANVNTDALIPGTSTPLGEKYYIEDYSIERTDPSVTAAVIKDRKSGGTPIATLPFGNNNVISVPKSTFTGSATNSYEVYYISTKLGVSGTLEGLVRAAADAPVSRAVLTVYDADTDEAIASGYLEDSDTRTDANGKIAFDAEVEVDFFNAENIPDKVYFAVEKNGYVKKVTEAIDVELLMNAGKVSFDAGTVVAGDIKGSMDAASGDGKVDVNDFVRLVRGFRANASADMKAACDINEDGVVTVADMAFVKSNFGFEEEAPEAARLVVESHDGRTLATESYLNDFAEMAELMKEGILETGNITIPDGAPVFYVSPNGSDTNNGTSENTPWKTLAKVNSASFAEGTYVLFERGGTWRSSGTGVAISAKKGVTYSAYGEGPKPNIYGSPENGTGADKWTLDYTSGGVKIWRYYKDMLDMGAIVWGENTEDCTTKAIPDYLADKTGTNTYSGGYYVRGTANTTGVTPVPFDYRTGLTANHMIFCKADSAKSSNNGHYIPTVSSAVGPLYFRCDEGNPGEIFDSLEFLPRANGIGIGSNANVHIDNLCIKYVGAHGIGAGTVNGLHVTNCEIGWIGGSIQGYNSNFTTKFMATRFGNGIEIYGGCDDYLIDNCYVYQCYDAGVTHQYKVDSANYNPANPFSPVKMSNVTYSNNLFDYCIYSIEYFLNVTTNTGETIGDTMMSNILFENNVLMNAAYGWGNQRPDGNGGSHIKGWSSPNPATNYVIRNNIFYRSGKYMIACGYGDPDWEPELYDNTFIQNTGLTFGAVGCNTTQSSGDYGSFDKYAELPFDRNLLTKRGYGDNTFVFID